MRAIRLFILTLACLMLLPTAGPANNYGLRLKSHDYSGGERTTLVLNGGKPIETGRTLEVRFRMSLREQPVFGNIVTFYSANGKQIDVKIIPEGGNMFTPTLNIGQDFYTVDYHLKGYNPIADLPVSISLDRGENRVTFSFGNRQRTVQTDLSGMEAVTIVFGNQRSMGGSADVVPIDIWNVRVDRDNQPLYDWELRYHQDAVSIDRLQEAPATATNGHWLQDDHTMWTHRVSITGREAQFAFDTRKGVCYVVSNDSLVSWNAITGEQTSSRIGGYRLIPRSYYFYANERRGTLHSYSMETGRAERLDWQRMAWENDEPTNNDAYYYDHGQASDGGDTLYAFGGYGHYRFNNSLYRIDTQSGEVKQLDYSPTIEPRVSLATALVGQRIYLFGGFGNEAGKQEIPRKFYNDLWEIDLTTLKAKRLWQSDSKEEFATSSSMIYDADQQAFYTMTNKRELIKISQKKPHWQVVTEKVDLDFSCRYLNFNIYRCDSLQQLFLVVNRTEDDENNIVDIFSIDLPIPDDGLIGQTAMAGDEGWSQRLLWTGIGLVILLAACGGAGYWLRRRRKVQTPVTTEEKPVVEEKPEAAPSETQQATTPPTRYYAVDHSLIQMLGELKVINREGEDITSKFTRRTRNLLILILLYSASKERGIAIRRLDEALWQEMDEEAARNNRNVYMRKLRLLLEEVGNVEIANDKLYYKASIGRDVLFDYQETLRLMNRMETNDSEELTARTLELLLRGPLLPGLSTEWLDDFKGDYSSRVIRLLSRLENRAMQRGDLDQAYRIAETIMLHDPFSEEALRTQCQILTKKKTVGIAKHVYDRFCKTYEQAMGEKYSVPFAEVCK